MKLKPMITYIRNGKKITKKINFFTEFYILTNVFSYSDKNMFDSYSYEISSEVEYIHLQNILFPSTNGLTFNLKDNQILILENCIFKGNRIETRNGNIQIINPEFIKDFCRIRINYGKDVKIILSEKNTETRLEFFIDSKNFFLDANRNKELNNLIVENAKKITLANLKNIVYLSLEASEEITLEKQNNILLTNTSVYSFETPKLNLGNSTIKAEKRCLYINADIITGKNYKLIADENIQINNNIYVPQNNETEIIITDKDLKDTSKLEARRKLISTLKTYGQYLKRNDQNIAENIKYQILTELQNQPIKDKKVKKKVRK